MKVIVGTQNGQLKVVNLDENVQTDLFGKYYLNNAVEGMCWANPDTEDLVVAGFSQGNVQVWNPTTRKIEYDCGNRGGKIKGLFTFENGSERMVVSCTDTKQLEVCPMDLPEDYKHTQKRLEGNNDSSIWRMRPNPISSNHVVYMGHHIMPTLYDMEKGKTVWRGKFGNPKFYGLKQRQFFTDFQFMPESASVFATGSRYREFRIYDLRQGSAPVMDFDVTQTSEWEFAMISLAVTAHTPTVIYATEATGKIASFDLRTGKLHKIYRDGMGTVKSLAFHPTERVMGAVSLDRYLRVYDIDKRLQKINDKTTLEYRVRIEGMVGANMHNKMFLKQKLTSILFHSEGRVKKVLAEKAEENQLARRKGEEGEEEDTKDDSMMQEDIWETLDEVGDVVASDDEEMMNIKDEPESDEEEDVKPKKKSAKKSDLPKPVKKEESEDEDEEDEDDDEANDDKDDPFAGLDDAGDDEEEEDDINLGEFNDDEDADIPAGEDDDSDDDDDDDEGEEGGEEGTKELKMGGKKVKGPKKLDNKKARRVAQEKEDKKKMLKRKKASLANAKKGRQLAKKRKVLSK